MNTWIDFKELRAQLDFAKVLRHYGVEVKPKGDQHLGFCPLPQHQGKKNSPSFSANLRRGIFQCFGCGAKGNALEFAAYMERIDQRNGSALRDVALKLREKLCLDRPRREQDPDLTSPPKDTLPLPQPSESNEAVTVVNEPLDFELKALDHEHPYLPGRGFTPATIRYFGLGFCARGMLKDRVAIPLHDQEGRLIGYAGRVVDDNLITDENPRYRFPGTRTRDGKTYEFRKGQFLYNGCRITGPVQELIVVEGFASVWWLHQNGFSNTVASMGADCSTEQAEIIVSLINRGGHVWIVPDADSAGSRLAASLFVQVGTRRFVRLVQIGKDKQPTDLSAEQLKTLFTM